MATKTKKSPMGVVRMRGGQVAVLDQVVAYRGSLVMGTELEVTRGRKVDRYFFTTEAVEGLGIWFVIDEDAHGERVRRAARQEADRAERLMHAFSDFQDVLG